MCPVGKLDMKKIVFNIKNEVYEDIRARLGTSNVSDYMKALVYADLKKKEETSEAEKAVKAGVNQRMDKMLDRLLLQKLEKEVEKGEESDLFETLPAKDVAQLIIQRSPKPKNIDEDLKATALSLSTFLDKLPQIGELDQELSRAKGAIQKLKYEKDLMNETLKALRYRLRKDKDDGKKQWSEFLSFFNMLMKYSDQYAKECLLRDLDPTPFDTFILSAAKKRDEI